MFLRKGRYNCADTDVGSNRTKIMTPIKVGTFLTLVTLISCSKPASNNNSKHVQIKHYTLDGELRDVYKTDLFINESRDSIIYRYAISDTVDLYTVGIRKGNDMELTHFKQRIPIVDRKTFNVDGKDIEIKKYNFDMPDEVDEEEYVYLINDYGLVSTKGHGWIYIIHFDDGGQFGRKAFELLQTDTSGFFGTPPL